MNRGVTEYVWKVWQGKPEEATGSGYSGYVRATTGKKTADLLLFYRLGASCRVLVNGSRYVNTLSQVYTNICKGGDL